ncbi:MAG: LamG domain-containing protein, partial [Armatimonadetes bacterium]|nr:LamG domain-containing protein [Armatimonadota bacterium]
DGQQLYLRLEEPAAPAVGDRWEVLLSASRPGPLRTLTLTPDGKCAAREGDQPWDSGAVVKNATAGGRWQVDVALPLARLVATGGPARVYLNVARRTARPGDEPVWSPTFGDFAAPEALRELVLDGPSTWPARLPSAAELTTLATQELVARWPLAEGQGSSVAGGGWSGQLTNKPRWTKEGGRPAVRLSDSARQFIDFGSPPAADLTGALTMLLWVRYEPTETWYPALLGKGYEATGTYGLHIRPGRTLWFEIDGPDGTRNTYNPTDACLSPGQWNQVAATYDGATMRVYLNGREVGPGKAVATAIRTNTEPLRFGWLGSYGFFNGDVRDIRLYRRAMSAAEVAGRYLAERW